MGTKVNYVQENSGVYRMSYDLKKVMGEALPDMYCSFKLNVDIEIFEARYDRMYCSSKLNVAVILNTLSSIPCPNEVEPSDHLPVATTF